MNRIIVITGSASGIGKAMKQVFAEMGDTVCGIDIQAGEYYQGDIADPKVLEDFAAKVLEDYGHVDVLINNALPLMKGIEEASWDEFLYAQKAGVAAPFYLAKLFKNNFMTGGSVLNICSTRYDQSQAQSETYAAAKGGLNGLTHAMAMSLGPNVRVNAISPGWIDTKNSELTAQDHLQHPAGRVGKPEDIAWLAAFLVSDLAAFIDGQNIKADGGMSRRMIYHGDENWVYQPEAQASTADETETVTTEEVPAETEMADFVTVTETDTDTDPANTPDITSDTGSIKDIDQVLEDMRRNQNSKS